MFHSVPGVPCAKMERFAGVDIQSYALPAPLPDSLRSNKIRLFKTLQAVSFPATE